MTAEDRRGPPRLVAWLLGRLAPPAARDHVLGDLEEEFAERVRRTGRRGPAVRWYVSQALRSLPYLLRERITVAWAPVDLRYALRALRRSPVFTTVAIGSLALGIGANTVAFTFVHGLLLEPLPFPDAEELVQIRQTHPGMASSWLSVPDYESIREKATTLRDVAAVTPDAFIVQGSGDAQYLGGAEVSTNYFDVLGALPLAGRLFGPQDEEAARVVIGEALWTRSYGRDPDAVGSLVELDGRSMEIVGVVSAHADILGDEEVWIPLRTSIAGWRRSRGTDWVHAIGRVDPVSVEEAHLAQLRQIGVGLAETFPETNTDQSFTARPLDEWLAGSMRTTLLILMGSVALVLLIVCANLAGILLARSIARSREIATRVALGVSRSRLFGQLLTESLVLAFLGGGLGVAIAVYGVPLVRDLLPADAPLVDGLAVDGSVLLFAAAISLGSLVLFGLAPALGAVRGDVRTSLIDRTPVAGRRQVTARRALVVGQMALALVLLVGASVLLRSFARLQAVELGIRTEGVVTARLPLVDADYPGNVDRVAHYERLLDAVRAAPGIEAAGMVNAIPLRDIGPTFSFATDEAIAAPEEDRLAAFTTVMGDYFDVMDIDVVSGRSFDPDELGGDIPAVVVDRAFERAFFPDGAVGGEIEVVDARRPIVGVVQSVPDLSPGAAPRPRMYVPLTTQVRQTMAVVAHSGLSEAAALEVVRGAVRGLEPSQTIQSPLPMSAYRSRSVREERMLLGLLGAMGLVALFLAALGTYGILAYVVSQRTREIGIRMAMGADPGSVRAMVLKSAGKMIAVALLVGAGLTLVSVRHLESVLFETSALDPLSFAGSALVLVLAAVAASYLPAVRATRTSPLEALRIE